MKQILSWRDHLAINSYWLGINIASGVITPVLLPFLVALYMPAEQKNTYLATIRVVSLAVAMFVQPVAGMLSDRSTSRYGRRRPFIFVGALLSVACLFVIGTSTFFYDFDQRSAVEAGGLGLTPAYSILLVGIVLLSVASNIGHGAVQGLIPDVVPENQRGRSSGVKAVLELLPIFLVLFIGPLVDDGRVWLVIAIIMAGYLLSMLATVLFVREEPQRDPPAGPVAQPILRILALTLLFVGITRAAIWLVSFTGRALQAREAPLEYVVTFVGIAGLVGMAGSIFLGVYWGAWIGIGTEARQHKSFIWWVINRLLFLAAVGSIQGFAQYYLADVMHAESPARLTTILLAAVAFFLIPSALFGGQLADRVGLRRMVAIAGLTAALGTSLLLVVRTIPLVIACGAIIGLGTGTFYATNWALGTELVPPREAGRFLGISNLAGAGAGIVGAGIGGPVADYFNLLSPGLGYLVIFAIYAALFLLSVLTLVNVRPVSNPGAFSTAAVD